MYTVTVPHTAVEMWFDASAVYSDLVLLTLAGEPLTQGTRFCVTPSLFQPHAEQSLAQTFPSETRISPSEFGETVEVSHYPLSDVITHSEVFSH